MSHLARASLRDNLPGQGFACPGKLARQLACACPGKQRLPLMTVPSVILGRYPWAHSWSAALPLAPVHLRDHGMADGRVHCFRGVPARHAIRPLLPACDDQLGCRSCTAPLSSQPPAARGTDSASRCRSPASRRAIISHTLAPRLKWMLQFLPTRWSVQVVPDFAASE